jgi:predicted RNA binding protein YcfA (HicA-like mRNA interferase family)
MVPYAVPFLVDLDELIEEARSNPSGVEFRELVKIVEKMGYTLSRTKGSHQIYKCPGRTELINLQRDGHMAKPYQVRQVLALFDKYFPEEEAEEEA